MLAGNRGGPLSGHSSIGLTGRHTQKALQQVLRPSEVLQQVQAFITQKALQQVLQPSGTPAGTRPYPYSLVIGLIG